MSTYNRLECEGVCDVHIGKVRPVVVLDDFGVAVLGHFNYCLAAIDADESNGFKVIEEPTP
ncbi:hypothetical protein [Luteibacter sp. E-22]|uniref:hypothetical protein n=1 Tax=Luteibacter sp. E-22 TaxID=3404050 RepID=UPI003CF2E2C6